MKSLSYFLLWIAAAGLVTLGCERHSFKDTKKLHGDHGHGDHGEHGDKHGDHGDKHDDHGDHGDHGDKHDDHGKKGDHGEGAKEKKDAAAKEKPRDTGI